MDIFGREYNGVLRFIEERSETSMRKFYVLHIETHLSASAKAELTNQWRHVLGDDCPALVIVDGGAKLTRGDQCPVCAKRATVEADFPPDQLSKGAQEVAEAIARNYSHYHERG